MSWWFRVALAILVPIAGIALLASAGVTNAYGTGTQMQANIGGWLPDGAQRDTFWDASFVDVPGLSVYSVHCHGQMHLNVQLGATGPFHNNPCYAAMGMYSGGSSETELYTMFPGGSQAIYRDSVDYGPWIYSIKDVVYYSSPQGVPG
jgi:hypothetical protein